MFWFLCLLAQPSFERQGGCTVFFPYGHCWAGYVYTEDLRLQMRQVLVNLIGFGALLSVAYELALQDHSEETASDVIYPELMLLLCYYSAAVFAITRGLTKVYIDLNGSAAGLRSARLFPVGVWRSVFVIGMVMTLGGVAQTATEVANGGDWLASSKPAAFFAVTLLFLLGQLRLSRRLRQQTAAA